MPDLTDRELLDRHTPGWRELTDMGFRHACRTQAPSKLYSRLRAARRRELAKGATVTTAASTDTDTDQ